MPVYDTNPTLSQLWPTKILRGTVRKSDAWHDELADLARDYTDNHMVKYESGFKHAIPNNMLLRYKSTALTEYFEILQDYFWTYMMMAADIGPSDITKPSCHMFGNVEKRGQWSAPHAHHGNQCVITFYPKVTRSADEPHPYAGSMVFHNPRTVQSGFWARKETLFTPFKVESGSIVAFPGVAEHSTFPFFDGASEKVALVCNVRFTGILEGENSGSQYQTFEALNKHREDLCNS
jgi:hypothetical protein